MVVAKVAVPQWAIPPGGSVPPGRLAVCVGPGAHHRSLINDTLLLCRAETNRMLRHGVLNLVCAYPDPQSG